MNKNLAIVFIGALAVIGSAIFTILLVKKKFSKKQIPNELELEFDDEGDFTGEFEEFEFDEENADDDILDAAKI